MLLGACATLFSGTKQTIHVDSDPQGAACEMKRNGVLIASFSTPAEVRVEKTKHDIVLTCSKPSYDNAYSGADSEIEGWVYGNLIIGGLVGWGIDSATGADNDYRDHIMLKLVPTSEVGGQYGFAPNR